MYKQRMQRNLLQHETLDTPRDVTLDSRDWVIKRCEPLETIKWWPPHQFMAAGWF